MTKKRVFGLTAKGLVVGVLVLLLLIPTIFIRVMVDERADRQREVAREVSGKWAGRQTVTGPVLIIPYMESVTERVTSGGTVSQVVKQQRKLCYVLPENLVVNGRLEPQERRRSIFRITVYHAAVEVSGSFAPVDFEELGIEPGDLRPDEAQLCFGVTDFRGIERQIAVEWDGRTHTLRAGVAGGAKLFDRAEGYYDDYDYAMSREAGDDSRSGLGAPVALDPAAGHDFSIKLDLRGSEQFNVTPVGKSTSVELSSPWADPSFRGMFLPNEPAEVDEAGFAARWEVMYLNRDYPQSWKNEAEYQIRKSDFGVELLQPVDNYAKTQRAVKYAILFIALTFVLCFLLEILQRRNVHPLQYVLVGLALCLFYTLLLSIGEYTGFNWAYLIASAATIALITWYFNSIFRKRGVALLFASALTLLYGFIFILLQLQDGALLFGSVGLFALLAAIMYYSRKVDWQDEDAAAEDKK